nr:hypothetical protein [Microvirga massiliensis]
MNFEKHETGILAGRILNPGHVTTGGMPPSSGIAQVEDDLVLRGWLRPDLECLGTRERIPQFKDRQILRMPGSRYGPSPIALGEIALVDDASLCPDCHVRRPVRDSLAQLHLVPALGGKFICEMRRGDQKPGRAVEPSRGPLADDRHARMPKSLVVEVPSDAHDGTGVG